MAYKCPQCGMTSTEPGMCPHCNVEMQPADGGDAPAAPVDGDMPPAAPQA